MELDRKKRDSDASDGCGHYIGTPTAQSFATLAISEATLMQVVGFSIVSVEQISSQTALSYLSASPANKPWVQTASILDAPCSLSDSAALAIVPPVEMMSSTMATFLPLTSRLLGAI